MMKKQLLQIIMTLFWVISFALSPVLPALAANWQDWQYVSPDIDGDGLLNELEATGWYNEQEMLFQTDPFDADSDDDGLSDGEEQLFGTNPLDPWDPGIYVRYQDNLKTKEYFSVTDSKYLAMKRGGDKYLMTEAMVARRGSQIFLGGPISATLTIANNGLTNLMSSSACSPASSCVEKDFYGGGWTIDLPETGTLGTYTVTLSAGGTQKEMPLHVIFELPQPTLPNRTFDGTEVFTDGITPADIEAFLYDDDSANLRDETAVIWRARYKDENYYKTNAKDFAQTFWTQHFQKFVFVDRVMPRIHGETNQGDVVDTLAHMADEDVRVNYGNYVGAGNTMSSTIATHFNGTGWTQDGSPCHSQAGAATSYFRAAGILASPFIVDWSRNGGDYDTSVRLWADGQWLGIRSYKGGENGHYPYHPFNHGITPKRALSDWDSAGYRDGSGASSRGDALVTANAGWDYEVWEVIDPSNPYSDTFQSGMVGDLWTPDPHMQGDIGIDSYWEWWQPLHMKQKSPYVDTLMAYVWQGDGWEQWWWLEDKGTVGATLPWAGGYTYSEDENWPFPAVPRTCTPGYTGGACPYPTTSRAGEPVTTPPPASSTDIESNLLQFGEIINDYGLDLDGDGRFDKLIVKAQVDVFAPGYYTVGGLLKLPKDVTAYSGLYAENLYRYLAYGLQTVELSFDASSIGSYSLDGPYRISQLWASQSEDFDPHLDADKLLVAKYVDYATRPYAVDQLETTQGARFAWAHQHHGLDEDGDGRYEAVAVDVALDIALPGLYRVAGKLYDSQGNFIGAAAWQGTSDTAALVFDIEKALPPYTLQDLHLFNAAGQLLDARAKKAYRINDLAGLVDLGAVTLNIYPDIVSGRTPLGTNITPTQVFSDRGVDLDGDGLYDYLEVTAQVQVGQAGTYRLEGWLEAPDGSLIVHDLSGDTALGTGVQTLTLTFDGRAINGHGADGPYTVVALKILDASSHYGVENELHQTGLALNYNAVSFEPEAEAPVLFSDDMEGGTGSWNWAAPWSHVDKSWPYAATLWEAEGTQNGALSSAASIDASSYVSLTLRFDASYTMTTASDIGYVEVATSGDNWARVATYTNAADHWATEALDLSDLNKPPSLKLRFNANPDSSLLWNVDNVTLNGWPGIKTASFSYSPVPVIITKTTTLTAAYNSVDMTLPVTYTWVISNEATIITTTPVITYMFTKPNSDYPVQLTVENPHDRVSTTQLVGTHVPVNGASFVYSPSVPEINDTMTFTATYMPGDAETPITYTWNFGDSVTGTTTSKTVTHSYSAGGNYIVELVASNGYGTANSSRNIEVKQGVAVVSFSVNPEPPIQHSPFVLTANISPTTASQPVTYTWKFDDGVITTTTTPAVEHVFSTVGDHTVSVTATNGYGAPAAHSNTVYVDGIPVGSASFTTLQIDQQNEKNVTFKGTAGPALVTQPLTYTWNFGNGAISATTVASTTASIAYEYPATGTYTVTLTVANGYGAPVVYSDTIQIPLDTDGDGLSDLFEISIGTYPDNPDSDGDNRTDYQEYFGYVYTNPVFSTTYTVTTDPMDNDSDDDGFNDGDEYDRNTDPTDDDTDDDGLIDGYEIGTIHPDGIPDNTDPLDPDSDDDTVGDYYERLYSVDASGLITVPVNSTIDTDHDGIPNGLDDDDDNDGTPTKDEDANGNGDPTDDDFDRDGVPDYLEANSAPQANNDTYNVDEAGTLPVVAATGVLSNDLDMESEAMTATLIISPADGTLNLQTNGAFTYTHNGSESPTDTFTYRATDSAGNQSIPATVTITINPVNDIAPVLAPIGNQTVAGGGIAHFDAEASDADSSDLVFSIEPLLSEYHFITSTGVFSWQTTAADVGVYTVTVTVSDQGQSYGVFSGPVLTDSQTITITVRDIKIYLPIVLK